MAALEAANDEIAQKSTLDEYICQIDDGTACTHVICIDNDCSPAMAESSDVRLSLMIKYHQETTKETP